MNLLEQNVPMIVGSLEISADAPGHRFRTVVIVLEDRCMDHLDSIDLWDWGLPFRHLRVRSEVEDVGDPE